MSKPNKKSTKLESSASAMPVGRIPSMQNRTKTKISSSASNITKTTARGTTKRKAADEAMTKDERYLGGGSVIYAEEEGTFQEEEGSRESELNANQASKRIKQEKEEEKTANSKCFDDWKDFYLQIFGNLKSKSDLIIAFSHYILTKNGFRCLGLGDDKTYAENEVGSINLPEGWNHFPKYAIRYIYNRMLHILLAVHLDHRLVINLLNTRTNVVTNITVFPEITVRATCGGPIDKLIPNPEKLAQSLYSNLIQTFTDTKACALPPVLQSGSGSQNRKTWEELELRQSMGRNVPIEEVVEEVERRNTEYVENQYYEMQDSPTQDIQIQDGPLVLPKRSASSINTKKLSKNASWANQLEQTASTNNNNNNNNKKDNNNINYNSDAKRLKALKTSLDEAVPSVKDAVLCYVDAMVNNWFGTYGKEIMKSSKMAIRNLTEQREIIEKYMQLAEPVTEPKGGFVIYNSKITLDDSKQRLLRENFDKDLRKWREEAINMNVLNEMSKPFTEVANESSKSEETMNASTVAERRTKPQNVYGWLGRGRTKSQKNFKNMPTKIGEGDNDKKVVLQPELKTEAKVTTPAVRPAKLELHNQKYKAKQLEAEINSAYKIMGLKDPITYMSTRKVGGSEAKSKTTQQNTATKATENVKRKFFKYKSSTTAPKKSKSNTSNFKSLRAMNPKTPFKKFSTAQVNFTGASPLKRIRFDLPRKFPPTPSYLSSKWPTTYKSLENLLKTSFPFSTQDRKSGGYEEMSLPLENYHTKQDFSGTKYEGGSIDTETQQNGYGYETDGTTGMVNNDAAYSMQSIEEHFAKQIEAKRLELLEMVRKRDLENNMRRKEEHDLHKKFIQPKIEEEKDVGTFVPPADEWSLWQFKLKLAEIRERETLSAPNKKIIFKN